jgi:hypothetical protein
MPFHRLNHVQDISQIEKRSLRIYAPLFSRTPRNRHRCLTLRSPSERSLKPSTRPLITDPAAFPAGGVIFCTVRSHLCDYLDRKQRPTATRHFALALYGGAPFTRFVINARPILPNEWASSASRPCSKGGARCGTITFGDAAER